MRSRHRNNSFGHQHPEDLIEDQEPIEAVEEAESDLDEDEEEMTYHCFVSCSVRPSEEVLDRLNNAAGGSGGDVVLRGQDLALSRRQQQCLSIIQVHQKKYAQDGAKETHPPSVVQACFSRL